MFAAKVTFFLAVLGLRGVVLGTEWVWLITEIVTGAADGGLIAFTFAFVLYTAHAVGETRAEYAAVSAAYSQSKRHQLAAAGATS